MALALVALSVMSAMTAVAKLTLALLTPPTARAITKRMKLSDTAHKVYEAAIPI